MVIVEIKEVPVFIVVLEVDEKVVLLLVVVFVFLKWLLLLFVDGDEANVTVEAPDELAVDEEFDCDLLVVVVCCPTSTGALTIAAGGVAGVVIIVVVFGGMLWR